MAKIQHYSLWKIKQNTYREVDKETASDYVYITTKIEV